MHTPKVTVLMPVYNAQRFLKRAIESVLSQTFTDFEFLIINDGSTDNSVSIIESFKDERIKLVHNNKNQGLVFTLNKGLELAKGRYIARMDGDDICLPHRFEKQVHYMEEHPGIVVLAAHIMQIDANEEDLGHWVHDIQTVTADEINASTAKTNCIAHSTVLMDTAIIQHYKYNPTQREGEDWDLWMRLVSDGKRIEKIPEVLVKYRLHPASFTAINNSQMVLEKKVNKIKITFLLQRFKKLHVGTFELLVVYAIIRTFARDIRINRLPIWLRFWKHLLTISPVKAYREFLFLKKTLTGIPNKSGIFFFFPYTHIGGAEKVHALITATVKDQQPFIFFTGFSMNKKFLQLFKDNGVLLNLPLGINHPFFKKRAMHLIVSTIEHHPNPVVFGCNNLFFYEMLPHLSSHVKVIDLMHDFRYDGEEWVSKPQLPLYMRCNKRVFISERALHQTIKFYKASSVESTYLDRLVYIPNYVSVPASFVSKNKKQDDPLFILYVGRGSTEKRSNLVLEIAKRCFEKQLTVQFLIVGNISAAPEWKNNSSITFYGELTDEQQLQTIYKKSNVILITSEREGFPMAIMEGMAQGVIPVSTPVGDVPKHIHHKKNGFLTSSVNAEIVCQEMTGHISELILHEEERIQMSKQAFEYAATHFSEEHFTSAYRQLLIGT